MESRALECFQAFNCGPFPFANVGQPCRFTASKEERDRYSLQHPARIDQNVTLILKHILRIVPFLNLHMPLLILLIPKRAYHFVVEANIFTKPVLVGNAFEIFQDFGRARVTATTQSVQCSYFFLWNQTVLDCTYKEVQSGEGAHEN